MRTLLLTVVVLSFFACGKIAETSSFIHEVLIPEIPGEAIKLSDLVDSVKLITLETTDQSIIGRIDEVLFFNELIIIRDGITDAILLFDEGGNFLSKINKKGRGPGEYLGLDKIMLDSQSEQIVIFDNLSDKMIYYSLNGTLNKETSGFGTYMYIQDIAILPDGRFLCYKYWHSPNEKDHGGLWISDPLGQPEETLLQYDYVHPTLIVIPFSYFFNMGNGKIGFTSFEQPDDYYYDIKKKRLIPLLHYSHHWKNTDHFEGVYTENVRDMKNYYMFRTVNEHKNNYVFTRWSDSNNYYYTLYCETDETLLLSTSLDYTMPEGKVVLSSHVHPPTGEDALIIVPNNSTDRIVATMSYKKANDQIEAAGLSDVNGYRLNKPDSISIDEMNPVLEILYIKNN